MSERGTELKAVEQSGKIERTGLADLLNRLERENVTMGGSHSARLVNKLK